MKRRITVVSIVIVLFVFQGCGFKLRNAQVLPAGISSVYLTGMRDVSPLKRAVENHLSTYQIPYSSDVPAPADTSTVSILLLPDTLDRRLLSLFATGQVAEYELVLTVEAQIAFPQKAPQTVSFDVTREYQDDPDAILAKSRELDLVLREMRKQASDRIIRMLPGLDNR